MKRRAFRPHRVLMLLFAGALALAPAIATQSAWAKDEHKGKHENEKGGDGGKPSSREEVRQREYFDDRRRVVVHEYYGEQFRTGHCPPGLAKKHNGCMPPGQAKKWAIGRPLPRDVIYYEVPSQLVVKIGTPPVGYKYVRVASDLLLIAAGTGMVIDAVQDLGRM